MIVDPGYSDFLGRYHAVSIRTTNAIRHAFGAHGAVRKRRTLEPVYALAAGQALAHATGIPLSEHAYALTDERGRRRSLREPLQAGYYQLQARAERAAVIVAPPHAFVPEELDERPRWGLAVQLYSLRSRRNWGIGDFGDLASLARTVAAAGGAAVALNPLHALDLTTASSGSPYSPLSRLFLNALYIDVPAAAARLHAEHLVSGALGDAPASELRESRLVEYPRVAALKLRALRALHAHLDQDAHAHEAFAAFVRGRGEPLRLVALYQALEEHFQGRDPQAYGWMSWPVEYQDPRSNSVAAFAAAHARDVEFYEFAQWLAEEQLARASTAASTMPIGLYRDLAVGVDAASADVWIDRDVFALGVTAGAPPDQLSESGQNWGLPPLNPLVLRERAYRPFIDVLRANMRHAGALRIDHVMGLMRLYCIPAGMPASEGAYVRYPFDELLAVLKLESVRNRCMIVGEDLGTVPPGFRRRMAQARIFSTRLLYFEKRPHRYPADAVASTGTHDLPPLRRYWEDAAPAERRRLLDILHLRDATGDADDAFLERLLTQTYRVLGKSAARLVLAQIEDVLLQREQVNKPGTTGETANWRHKIDRRIEDLAGDAGFQAVTAALAHRGS